MRNIKKSFSILLCLMLSLTFSALPVISFAETSTGATTAKTNSTTAKTNSTTTNKTDATTKKTTQKTTKKTTQKTNSSSNNNGKLTVSSKRSTEGSGEGGKVKIIYTINNTGDVTAKNLKLKDSDIAGSQTIASIDSLDPGASKTVEYEATMTRDSNSTPVITCTMNGASRTFTGESSKISLTGSSSSLSATLTTTSTGIQPNTPVKFSLLIKNDDSSRVTDISISDYAGKSIKSGINLDAGSTTNVDFELTMTGDTNVYVTVKGKNSNGDEISVKSNELAMKADANAVPVNEGLSVLLHADKTTLDKKGEVKLTLEIKNLMPKSFSNVSIVDKATGTNLQTITLLAGNDSKTYTSTIAVNENTSFLYEATATYEDGTAITVQSNSLEITVGGKSLLGGGMTIIIIIVVIVVILIIATSITLYILSKKENEEKKSIGAAQSEKYRRSTPKKKAASNVVPPSQPISTFTIDEDYGNENSTPSFDTAPIQIPNQDNSFDNYGAGAAFDASNLENTNPTQTYGSENFGDNQSNMQNDIGSDNEFHDSLEENNQSYVNDNSYNALPEDNGSVPEQPLQEEYPNHPHSNAPIDYNDLDPD